MSPWKTAKRYRGGKPRSESQPFLQSGDPKAAAQIRAIRRGKFLKASEEQSYLHGLLKETNTHDINIVIEKLLIEGRETGKDLQEADKVQGISKQKLDVVNEVLKILHEIRESGRTRVGDTELKQIIRDVMRDLKVAPQVFKEIDLSNF